MNNKKLGEVYFRDQFGNFHKLSTKDFNKKMRQIAKNKGYTLSEYELVNKKGKQFIAKSEKDIFKKLGMEYLPPKLR